MTTAPSSGAMGAGLPTKRDSRHHNLRPTGRWHGGAIAGKLIPRDTFAHVTRGDNSSTRRARRSDQSPAQSWAGCWSTTDWRQDRLSSAPKARGRLPKAIRSPSTLQEGTLAKWALSARVLFSRKRLNFRSRGSPSSRSIGHANGDFWQTTQVRRDEEDRRSSAHP